MPGPGLLTDGVLTRTVRDTALALDILGKPRVGSIYHVPQPQTSFLASCDQQPSELRVGVLTASVITDANVHPEALAAVEKTVSLLQALGHHVEQAPTPFAKERWGAFGAIWAVGALGIDLTPEQELQIRPLTRWLREQGKGISGLEFSHALAAAQSIARDTQVAWADYDIILTPTLAQPPAKIGALRNDADPAADFQAQTEFTPWGSIYNVSGLPAISLPLHTAEVDGVTLPFGVMLGARFGCEDVLLAVSAQLEAAAPWQRTVAIN
jgi:amidase